MKIHIRQEATRVSQQVSRARAAGLPATLTTDEWIERVYQFGGLCAYCQTVPFDDLDHLLPFSLGGGTVADNCAPVCQPCNVWKNGRALCERNVSFDEQIAQIRVARQNASYLPLPGAEESDLPKCKYCTRPIEIKEIGPNKREYCSPRCKQSAYRERERERKIEASHRNVMVDAESTQQRIAELEQELAFSQRNLAAYQEKVTASIARIQRLESQVETQRLKLKEAYHSKESRERVIVQQEQRNAELERMVDEYINRKRTPPEWKKQLQERFWQHGKATDWPALSIRVPLQAGEKAYRVFGLAASNELLEWASVALRNRDQS